MAMLRRGWKIWSATYRTKLDSLGRIGGQASNRNQIPAYSDGGPPPTGRRMRRDVLPASGRSGGGCASTTIGP